MCLPVPDCVRPRASGGLRIVPIIAGMTTTRNVVLTAVVSEGEGEKEGEVEGEPPHEGEGEVEPAEGEGESTEGEGEEDGGCCPGSKSGTIPGNLIERYMGDWFLIGTVSLVLLVMTGTRKRP